MSTAIGYFFGHSGAWFALNIFHTLIGTALMASGTAALNQWYERESDLLMNRTKMRPLPSGRLLSHRAMWFGIALAIAGTLELGFGVNWLTAGLCVATLFMYLFLYTPLKQRTWWSTTIGAFPGAMPPLIGFAGAAGKLTAEAWVLGAILFLWQFPHFYAIAWMYREDFGNAGLHMVSVNDATGQRTATHAVISALVLFPVSLLPSWIGHSGLFYAVVAGFLSLVFLAAAIRFARQPDRPHARTLFLTSIIYLPLILIALVVDLPIKSYLGW